MARSRKKSRGGGGGSEGHGDVDKSKNDEKDKGPVLETSCTAAFLHALGAQMACTGRPHGMRPRSAQDRVPCTPWGPSDQI